MLESWNVGKLECWKVGMLESWEVGNFGSWKVMPNKIGKLESEPKIRWTKAGKSAPKPQY